jgi:hypothetical protein
MPIKVDSIKTIYFAGQNRRIFYIKEYYPLGNPWFPYACQWIEGFGRTKINGKMIGPIDDFEWYVNELLCFWKTGQLFYQNTTYWSCLIIHVGINETKGFDNLKIFPNPVKTELIIDNIPNSIENLFVIYNCLGQEMLRLNSKESSKQIDITNMPSGIYILKIINQDSMTVEKFIKK